MTSGPMTSFMENRQGNNGNSDWLYSCAPKSLQMVTAAMKLKDVCSLEETKTAYSTSEKPLCQQRSINTVQFSSAKTLSRIWLFTTPWTAARQASLSITNSGVYPNPCLLSQWCHPTISSSVIPFFSCPQSFPVSGSFPMSQLFASGGQSIGVSASTSVLPMNTQDWSLGWTAWVSLQSKELSRVFSSTTVQKHQFFGAQLSL